MRMRLALLVCILALVPKPAAADLIDLGNGIIYSTELDMMFLQDLNTPFTTGYDTSADGRMSFPDALVWIEYLNVTSYLGYSDWRLASSLPNMWFDELENVTRAQPGFLDNSMGPFINNRQFYWLGLGICLPERNHCYGNTFDTHFGFPDAWPLPTELSVTAQRRGAPVGVPEPSTFVLMALGALGAVGRRFKSRINPKAELQGRRDRFFTESRCGVTRLEQL